MYKSKVLEVIGSTIGSDKESDKSTVEGEPRRTNDELEKGTESTFGPWMLAERKRRIDSRSDVLIDENEMSDNEKGIAKEFFRVCRTEADQPNTCVPSKLGGAGSSGNGLIGKLNSLATFSKPDSDH
ncbi:hypothetical protein Gorai_007351 [Gossypium raimondii]|uniref:Uncharacterized protein n=1 Tax=Gossypium raimondii TaxID=29730 RepID=A0A7J8Q7X6_GOSRA|nr:hypothetical protein [Gossypium raimondii]